MIENVGRADGVIRLLVGFTLFVLAAILNATPALSLLAALAGIVMVGTALTRRCPLYALFGIDTCPHHRPR